MNTLPKVFQLAAKEFDLAAPTPHPNRQWVQDANALLRKGNPQYPPGVVSSPAPFNVSRLTQILYMSHVDLRFKLYKLFTHPDFHPVPGETLAEERNRVMRMWGHIVSLGVIENTLSTRTSEGHARYDAVIESCGFISHSLDIKLSVHYGLFGSTISMMGDDAQRNAWGPQIERCEMLGCFALTELGHGSNTRDIETTATYDIARRQFIIHTPTETAQKYWIGGAAITGRWSSVFAQLFVNNVCYGIHAFLVRIRHDDGTLVDGVRLADCGHKCGMNGVDNGRMWFDQVRIPHGQMLRRLSQVSVDGKFTSQFKSADERFGASLAQLSGGRVSVASGLLNQAKVGLAIAVRYGLSRKAFGPAGKEETRLLDYALHQHRLIPRVAGTIALQVIHNKLKRRWQAGERGKELHVWSSGFKAVITWYCLQALQEARESCGGQGYKTENRIGELKNSHDVAVTYEGDNHILLQVVARVMLGEFVRGVRSGKFVGHFGYLKEREKLRHMDVSGMNVMDDTFISVVMRRREAALFSRLGSEVERRVREGATSMEAVNGCAVLAEEAGRAHTEVVMHEVLQGSVKEMEENGDKDVAEMVRVCGKLLALSQIDGQSAFLRLGALSAGDADRVHAAVQRLCQRLRPHVLHLVDAFGIPPHLLAPIAFDYVSHNQSSRL